MLDGLSRGEISESEQRVIQHMLPTQTRHIAAQPCQQTWGMEAWKRNPASPNRGCRGRPAASSSASCRPTSSGRKVTK